MKKGFRFGCCLVLGVLFVVSSVAQEGILWVDKFSGKEGPGGIPEGWDLEKKTGNPEIEVEKSGDNAFVHFSVAAILPLA